MAMLNNQRVTSNFPKHTHLENHNPSTICRSWSPTETIYLFIFHIYVRKKNQMGQINDLHFQLFVAHLME